MSDDLKPCPFCGGEVAFNKSSNIPPSFRVFHLCQRDYSNPHRICIETKWCKTMSEAADIWNRRTE